MKKTLLLTLTLSSAAFLSVRAEFTRNFIDPGAVWPDNRGEHIQAHGGGIVKEGDTYYWFGEDRSDECKTINFREKEDRNKSKPDERWVACYASKDLMNWEYRGRVAGGPPPEDIGTPYVLERPKVYPNKRTGKYVMYVHLDDKSYKYARVAVYVSDTIDGQYEFLHSFRPLDKESRDIGQFIDDDGTAYLIFESRPTKGFYITKLSDDYLTVEEETCFIRNGLEGGTLVHYDGLYYIIGSWMTGWNPNPNQYATAPTLEGPWSEFKDVAPPKTNTYNSQSTLMLKVEGTKDTSVIFMGDQWRPNKHCDGRYIWMPLEIGNGKLWIPEPKPWSIDIETGETTIEE